MYTLHIANKNYSSWSLRPWVLMRELGIAFEEHLVPFDDAPAWEAYRRISPSGKVPCLVDGDVTVWDSLAITEYLAERHEGVWPADAGARAWARSAAAEMHSGFAELRERCSMSCGLRVRLHDITPALQRDIDRIDALWNHGLARFGGPFLAGQAPTAVDAFYAPVAFRIQTFSLKLSPVSMAWVSQMLAREAMQAWYREALAETFREEAHDADTARYGTVLQDLRVPARAG